MAKSKKHRGKSQPAMKWQKKEFLDNVRELYFDMGISAEKIASQLGCNIKTVYKAIDYLDELITLKDVKDQEKLAKRLTKRHGNIISRAWEEALKAETPSDRNRFLNTVLKATDQEIAMLQRLGIVHEAPKKTELSGEGPVQIHFHKYEEEGDEVEE